MNPVESHQPETSRWWVDGERLPDWTAWQAEDVLLETLRIADGRVLRAGAHAARMLEAAQRRGVAERVLGVVSRLASFVPCRSEGAVRWFLPLAPVPGAPRYALEESAWERPERAWARGVALATVDIPHPRDGLWGKSAQRRPWRIAREQALAQGADEGLLMDGDRVLESDSGALLWKAKGVWHAVDAAMGVLPSVTLAALAPRISLQPGPPPTLETLRSAEGVALVSALRLAVGVTRLNGAPVATDLQEMETWRKGLEAA